MNKRIKVFTYVLTRVFLISCMIMIGFLLATKGVEAECRSSVNYIGCGYKPNDICTTAADGTADGTAYFGEGNLSECGGLGYYYHDYYCDGACGGPGTPGCFVPGTLVGNSSEGKKIEDIKVGDVVTSFKDDKIVESKVSQIYKVTRDYYFKLVADDYEVKVTAEHPFYIGNDEFEETQNLKVGDTLYVDEDGEMIPKTISSLTRIDEPTDAYNMTVDNTNTYFANGFAVHNKGDKESTTYSCDAGYWPDWNQIADSQCIPWGTSVSGNAIRVMPNGGVYCLNTVCIPNEWETCPLTPFQYATCCPNGTVSTPTDTVGVDYTYTHDCHDNGGLGHVCQNATDIWKSDVRDMSSWCYDSLSNCVTQKDGEVDCDVTPIYDFSTTCTRVTRTFSCVPTCSNVNPASPYKTSPANGATLATTSVGLAWNEPASWGTSCNGGSRSYFVRVSTSPTLSSNNTDYVLGESVRTQLFPAVNGTTYYWSVAALNGTLDSNATNTINSFTIQSTIGGRVYDVENNVCPGGVGSNFGGLNVQVGGTSVPVASDGTYSVTVEPGSYIVSVGILPEYSCANGTGCGVYPCTKIGVLNGTTGLNFYLSSNKAAWWQAEGATIYAGGSTGVTVGSTIPASIPDLDRYLIVEGALGSLSSGSILRSSATAASLGAGGASVEGYQARTIYRGDRANYSYFKNEMGLLTTTDSLLNLDTKPTDEAAFHYIDHPTALGDSLGTPWTVDADEKFVIFVNGDLDINADITVAPGGFAAFIVNGSINVSPDVENLQGMFVANQNFNTVSNGTVDTQLTVEGSVVAWGDVSLDRDLVTNNSNSPAEKFVYRPDLLISMPDEMKSFVMQWSEVVPGTYDE